MRIGVLTSRYPAVSHTFIRREVEALRAHGLDVETFSVRRPAAEELLAEADREAERTTFHLLPMPAGRLLAAHAWALARRPRGYLRALGAARRERLPGARGALWALFHFAEAVVLARALCDRGVGHLHSHFANAGATVGLLATRVLGIGWSVTLHGTADFDGAWAPRLGARIGAARFVACISDAGRARAMHASAPEHWARIFRYRCGLDLGRWPRPAPRDEAGGRPRVVSVGRLAPEKAQVGLLDALERLSARGIDAELHLVGEGPERPRLEARIRESEALRDRVVLRGALPPRDVAEALAAADAFALSSLMEGLPVVLCEALAAGVAPVAPRLAGIPELVEDGRTGLLYTPGRWDQLADALARLLEDPALRRRLAEAGRRRVEEEFEIHAAVEPLAQRLRALG